MKKLLFFLFSFFFFFVKPVYAHCPLCTGAMVTGVAATRYFGVSDLIVGIFTGGLIISTALWFNRSKLKKKYLNVPNFLTTLAIWIMTVLSFYFAGIFQGHMTLGINSLLFGVLLGTILTLTGSFTSSYIKSHSKKILFPFQTLIITLLFLVLASFITYLII